ncbi:MAG: B12-binding domain-containing radical SAM protein [Desulfobacterales bacterium]|nr:MAG: B12-binding domain-containing radical SAM protein [Desulfobacterales bacterium]
MKTDPPHILCVNPWIHDFAAFDFWAKPMGLFSMAAVLRDQGLRVSYLDCMNRFHPRQTKPPKVHKDGRGPFDKTPIDLPSPMAKHLPHETKVFSRYGTPKAWIEADLEAMAADCPPDLIMVTSLMTYWASGVAETIETIKHFLPGIPVVLGGIYASLCDDHARQFSGADHVLTGPGEPQIAALIKRFTGVTLDHLPAPDNLDAWPFPALDLQDHMAYAPILTSRGCPFSCEYCASSFLEPRLRRRSPDHVFKEIRHWHDNFGVTNFPFYDDALLINPQQYAFPLLEKVIASDMDIRFHTPNALHIREVTPASADLMYRAGFKAIRLGLETTDFSKGRQHDIKVRKDEFFTAVDSLKNAGFKREQLGAYLLCGLPGQDLDDVESSMNLVKSLDILPVLAYYTPIPHTPMWDVAVQHARLDITAHPGLTNNSLFPCVTSSKDMARISQLKKMQK